MTVSARPMSSSEREFLQGLLKDAPGASKRWIRGTENAFVLFAALLLLFVIAWWIARWLVLHTIGDDIGISSPAAVWIAIAGVATCAAIAIHSTLRWIQGWKDARPSISADLAAGEVVEEQYQITDTKRFQEPEHGGLIYFLRTSEDKVLVLYDHESAQLGARDEDPMSSQFTVRMGLHIVRAPHTRYILEQKFFGDVLDPGEPIEITAPPSRWPEQDEYCDIPWHQLEPRLAGAK